MHITDRPKAQIIKTLRLTQKPFLKFPNLATLSLKGYACYSSSYFYSFALLWNISYGCSLKWDFLNVFCKWMRGRFHCFLVVKKIYNANLNCKFSDNGHTFKCMQIKFEVHVWFSKVSFFHSKIFFKAFITLKNDKKLAFRRFFNRNYDLIGLRSDCGVVS